MPSTFSNIWSWFYPYSEEDSFEILELDESTTPENEQPVPDLNAQGFVVAETSDISSNNEIGRTSHNDANPETGEICLTDNSRIGSENEELQSIASTSEACELPTGDIIVDSWNSNGEIRRRCNQSLDEERRSSSGQDDDEVDDDFEFDVKILQFDKTTSNIGSIVSFLAFCFGLFNIGNCPADFYLPFLVLFMGIMGLFIVEYVEYCLTENERNVVQVFGCAFVVLWLGEFARFCKMDASFDVSAENYCNPAFYVFVIILNIVSILGTFIGFLLFGPAPDERDSLSPQPGYTYML